MDNWLETLAKTGQVYFQTQAQIKSANAQAALAEDERLRREQLAQAAHERNLELLSAQSKFQMPQQIVYIGVGLIALMFIINQSNK